MAENTEQLIKLIVKTGITSSASWFLTATALATQTENLDINEFKSLISDCKQKGIEYQKVSHDGEKISDYLINTTNILLSKYIDFDDD